MPRHVRLVPIRIERSMGQWAGTGTMHAAIVGFKRSEFVLNTD